MTAPQPDTPLRRAAFLAGAALVFAAAWMALPLGVVLLARAGFGPAATGLFGALFWAGAILAAPLLPLAAGALGGPLRLHRRAGLALAALLAALALLPPGAAWFLLVLPLGAAACLAWTAADWEALAIAPRRREGSWLGLYQTVASAGIGLGPLLVALGGAGQGLFWAAGGLALAGLAAGLASPPPHRLTHRPRLGLRRLAPLLRALPVPAGAAALAGAVEATAGNGFPVAGLSLGLSAAAAAGMAAATGLGNLVTQWPAGRIADRLGLAVAFLMAGGAAAAGAVLWPPAAPGAGMWVALALFGGAGGALYTLALIAAARRARAGTRGAALAGLNIAYLAGASIGAQAGGLVLAAFPGFALGPLPLPTLGLSAALALLLVPSALLLAAGAARVTPPGAPGPPPARAPSGSAPPGAARRG
jgi:hypothetical protein